MSDESVNATDAHLRGIIDEYMGAFEPDPAESVGLRAVTTNVPLPADWTRVCRPCGRPAGIRPGSRVARSPPRMHGRPVRT